MDSCDYASCEADAKRHLFYHHFCNEHNWYLRRKAQREEPADLRSFLKRFVQQPAGT